MEVETMITEELVAAAKENGVEVAQKLASIVSGDPLSISMLGTNKAMKAEVGKTKQLGLELTKSMGTVKKLQEDLDKHVAYLSSKVEENKALSGQVADPEQQMNDIGKKMEDLTSEKKTTKAELGTVRDEMAEMKEALAKMEIELREKEEVESALKDELNEAKRLIVINHLEGLKKA
ncbi:hypothetical protein JHK87_029304 [Glycine soja]|nr:hypothetical protein JHK87_029304 [Glycine soja]